MQCYEYLAIRHYARRHLGEWTEELDDLDLAQELDNRDVESLQDVMQLSS